MIKKPSFAAEDPDRVPVPKCPNPDASKKARKRPDPDLQHKAAIFCTLLTVAPLGKRHNSKSEHFLSADGAIFTLTFRPIHVHNLNHLK
jgi:hypothetical protein